MLVTIRYPNSQRGAVSLWVLVAILAIATFCFATIHEGVGYQSRIKLQRSADLAVTSGAIWEARTYNLIAAMNQGILIYMTLAFLAALTLMALIACSATVVGAPACAPLLAALEKPLTNTITNSWTIANELSKWERQVIKLTPPLVIAFTIEGGQKNDGVTTLPYPYLPEAWGGKHENASTLTFHTRDGGFQDLLRKIFAKLAKTVPKSYEKYFNQILKFIQNLIAITEMPDPLILDEDFRPRMKLGVVAKKGDFFTLALSQTTVFLPETPSGEEDLYEMDWRVRLTPVDFHQELPKPLQKALEHHTFIP